MLESLAVAALRRGGNMANLYNVKLSFAEQVKPYEVMMIKRIVMILSIFVLLLSGCTPSLVSEKDMPDSSEQSVNTDEVIPFKQEILSLLTERAETSPQGIPIEYLEEVARYTKLPYLYDNDSWELFKWVSAHVIESDSYYVILLKLPTQFYWAEQPHEYHVFHNEKHIGMISSLKHIEGFLEEQKIWEYDGHAWLTEKYFSRGSTGSSFSKGEERWYEISHPSMKEVLRFTSWNGAGLSYSSWLADVYYTAEIVKISHDQDRMGFYIVLEWKETIKYEDEPVIHGEGTVIYDYIEHDRHFERGNFYHKNNLTFEDSDTTHGRPNEEVLIMYIDQIVKITENGSEKQKEWLRVFLDDIRDTDKYEQLYRWYKSEDEAQAKEK